MIILSFFEKDIFRSWDDASAAEMQKELLLGRVDGDQFIILFVIFKGKRKSKCAFPVIAEITCKKKERRTEMMVATEPRVSENGRYSLREACELLGVHKTTMIRWVKEGKIRYGIRRSNYRKFYLGRELVRFWRAQL